MSTIAIDRNTLNELFDNQKKMDDLFDTVFDDDNFFIHSSSSIFESESHNDIFEDEGKLFSVEENDDESVLATTKHNSFYFLFPVMLEIAAIYYVFKTFV